RQVGALLFTAGLVAGMMPPPPGPFDMTLILTGAIVLWPRRLGAVEGWMRRRYPRAHHRGMVFLDRFLADLERRYSGQALCPTASVVKARDVSEDQGT